jgi:hypothetical protein
VRPRVIIWVLILTAVLLLPRIVLPGLFEKTVVEYLEAELGGESQIKIQTRFGWELLFGRFASISIYGRNWNLNGLPIAAFELSSRDAAIDVQRLLQNGDFAYLGAEELHAELILSEAGLNQYFWERLDRNQLFTIDLRENQAALNGTVELWQISWSVSLLTELQIIDPAQIVIMPVDFLIEDTRVPSLLLELVSEAYTLQIDLGDLPIPIQLDEIRIKEDRIELYGSGA